MFKPFARYFHPNKYVRDFKYAYAVSFDQHAPLFRFIITQTVAISSLLVVPGIYLSAAVSLTLFFSMQALLTDLIALFAPDPNDAISGFNTIANAIGFFAPEHTSNNMVEMGRSAGKEAAEDLRNPFV